MPNPSNSPANQKALYEAVKADATQTVQNLLANGVATTYADTKGNTPLHIAALIDNSQMLRLLLNDGAKINAQNNAGQTPIQLISHECSAEMFCDYPTDENDSARYSTTLLRAVAGNNFQLAERLLRAKASQTWVSKNEGYENYSCLHWAVENDNPDMILLLRSYNADENAVNNQNLTPLSKAISEKKWNCTEAFTISSTECSTEDLQWTAVVKGIDPTIVNYQSNSIGYIMNKKFFPISQTRTTNQEYLWSEIAKAPNSKEALMKAIFAVQDETKKLALIDQALNPKKILGQLFAVQRGWLPTSNARGCRAQLIKERNILNSPVENVAEVMNSYGNPKKPTAPLLQNQVGIPVAVVVQTKTI